MPPLGLFMYCLRFRHTTYALLGCKRTRRKQRFAVQTKASYESWEAQLTRFDSWTITASSFFFINRKKELYLIKSWL